jgi:hypothetical protein
MRRLSALLTGVLALFTLGCGSPPTSPSVPQPLVPQAFSVAQPLTGAWSGFLRITESSVRSGVSVGEIVPFLLQLDGVPAAYSGAVLVGPLHSEHSVNVLLSGAEGASGFTALSGSRVTDRRGNLELVEQLAVKTNSVSGLEGAIRFGKRSDGAEYHSAADIMSASWRSDASSPALTPGPYDGLWKGGLTRTACSGDCQFVEDQALEITLGISQVGSSLTAALDRNETMRTELKGTASDTSLVLTGHYINPSCPTRHGSWDEAIVCEDSVTFSGWIDPRGGLRGTMERHQEGFKYSAREKYAWTASFELADVVHMPFVMP